MTARSDVEFWIDAYNAPARFERNAQGAVSGLNYRGIRAPRVEKPVASPPASGLATFVGVYESDELSTSYRVELKNGGLAMQHFRHGTIPLTWTWSVRFRKR